MNNLEKYFFDQADQANETFTEDPSEDFRDDNIYECFKRSMEIYGDGIVQIEIDQLWEDNREYWEGLLYDVSPEEMWCDRYEREWDLREYLYSTTEWEIDELEDYVHLCELCGIRVETETAQDVLDLWDEMTRFWNGTPEDDEEELLAESESEERSTRTRADRRKNAFKAKARRVEILKNKGFSPEYEYCEKWLRQGKKMSEIRSKKSKDNVKSYRQARRARRNPNLSGKGNAYRRTTRGWYD